MNVLNNKNKYKSKKRGNNKYNKYMSRQENLDNLNPSRVASYNFFLQEMDKHNLNALKDVSANLLPFFDKTMEENGTTADNSIKPIIKQRLKIDINTCNNGTNDKPESSEDLLIKYINSFNPNVCNNAVAGTNAPFRLNLTTDGCCFTPAKNDPKTPRAGKAKRDHFDKDIQDAQDNQKKKEILKTVHIDETINNIQDILAIIDKYPDEETTEYNINIHSLNKIKVPLQNLNAMIGMKGLKDHIVDQILYYIQNLHKIGDTGVSADFMHTVIYGEPGTGKTEIAKIIGSIFANLGILKKGVFNKVTRSDLIAGYLGQTAIKTKDVIHDSLGGVLFIDEAYALGNTEKRDSFSKECIDTLCEGLSAHKENLMVIIAGYEKELQDCFFNYNKGLESRFTWRFETEEYNSEELFKIFLKMVTDIGWTLETTTVDKITIKWFELNKDSFKYYGRDIETLLSKTKIAHSRRVFCLKKEEKTKIILGDLENGFKIYLKHKDNSAKKDKLSESAMSMYS
jgi:SpoVK/Ycf46/Vps4 family AAA+-type ATPase